MYMIFYIYRYLVWLEVFLTNIDKSHPGAKELLKKGGIAVARSLIPGALSAVDKTMEETFMKHAKNHNQASGGSGAGLFGLEGKYNANNGGYVQQVNDPKWYA